MLVDSHIHSHYSTDSRLSPRQISRSLKDNGLRGILTDHYDFDHTQGDYFTFDVREYTEDPVIKRLKNLSLGIEMGLRPELRAINEKHASLKKFDFLLGSLHFAYREDEHIDFTIPAKVNLVPFYHQYWKSLVDAIEDNGYIHALGHIDYPARYQSAFKGEIPLGAISDLIHECFRLMARKEISLEINTCRLGEKQALLQWKWLLRAYRDSGGETVTFGSDAHALQEIGRHFDVAHELAMEADLFPVYYRKGQAIEMGV